MGRRDEPDRTPPLLLVEPAPMVADDGSVAEVAIQIPLASGVAGGPLSLSIRGGGIDLAGEQVLWVVTTNSGWIHFRGTGRLADGTEVPFRCDLRAGSGGETRAADSAQDPFALRVYGEGADPERESPVLKLNGGLPAGTVSLSRI